VTRGAALPEVALGAGTRVIADLHLDPEARGPWQAFEAWITALADAPALLVLGDLFEYWTGPGQARLPEYARLFELLRARVAAGTALHVLHGNRDFLLGSAFERAVGARVHPDGLVGLLPGGRRALFLHGDELATQDRSYQRLRTVLRSAPVRLLAGAAPGFLSRAAARALRRRSRVAVAGKPPASVELQPAEARDRLARAAAAELVCGHAHRYREELLEGGGRWRVLDAFGGTRDVLRVGADGALVVEGSARAPLQPRAPALSSRAGMIIALDGPAGVGKSSLARRLARELGFFFLDTGAMYRAVTLAALRREIDPRDAGACTAVAHELVLDFDAAGGVLLDGAPGEPAIRSSEVNRAVSHVSAHPHVREAVVARQREIAAAHDGVVAEGRDTTTVVFPHAEHKFFLTASAAERALRRARQEDALERLDAIRAEIEERDRLDSSRAHSPLRPATGAHVIETDRLDPDQVLARILEVLRKDVG